MNMLESSQAYAIDPEVSMQREIAWAECELAAFQRGFLLLRLDFAHNVLIWKDSNRWFNNFVRGLPRDQMTHYRQAVCQFIEEQGQREHKHLTGGQHDLIWRLSFQYVDSEEEIVLSGSDLSSLAWRRLAAAFTEAAGRNFSI